MTRPGRALGPQLLALALIAGCVIVEAPTTEVMGPSTVVLRPASTRMVFIGQTKQFNATVRDVIGRFRRPPITWASSDGSVFTVDDGGLVTAVGNGTAELRATADGATATASVTVEQTAASIRVLSGAGQQAIAGMTLEAPIVVRVVDEGGTPVPGVTVSFKPAEGNGSVSRESVEVDAAGEASTSWTLGGDRLGPQSLGVAAGTVERVVKAFASPEAPIPDLAIEGALRLATETPTDLEEIEVTVNVANTGDAVTPRTFPLTLSVDGEAVETFDIERLEAGERVELTYDLDPLEPGAHEVAVSLDRADEIEEWFEDNNGASTGFTVVRQRVIEVGESVEVSSSTVDEVILFRIDVADGMQKVLDVRLSGGNGDADLFVQYGERPGTQYEYGCQSGQPDTGELCQLVPVRAGSYHVAVHAFSAFGPTTLTVKVVEDPIEPFDIDVRFAGSFSAARQDVIREAVKRWESVIARGAERVNFGTQGFQSRDCVPDGPLITGQVDDLVVLVGVDDIDGEGGVVATGRPCMVRTVRFSRASTTRFQEVAVGGIVLDESDLAGLEEDGMLSAVVAQKTGHALGFGFDGDRLWDRHGLLADPVVDGVAEPDTHFTGPLAIAAFNAVGGTGYAGAGVPVENTGGPEFANDHWRESVFGEELMTAVLTSTTPPLSLVTIESLADIGYGVDLTQADEYTLPTPGTPAVAGRGRPTAGAGATGRPGATVHAGQDIGRQPIRLIERGRLFVKVGPPRGK